MAANMYARGTMHVLSRTQESAREDESEGQSSAHSTQSDWHFGIYIWCLPHTVCKQLVITPLYLSASVCLSFSHAVSQLVLSISSNLFTISLVTYSNTGVELQGLHNPARRISSQPHLD